MRLTFRLRMRTVVNVGTVPTLCSLHTTMTTSRKKYNIDRILKKRRDALEGWLEFLSSEGRTIDQATAVETQLMVWEQEEFSRQLVQARKFSA